MPLMQMEQFEDNVLEEDYKKIDAFSQRTLIDGGDVFSIAVVQGEKPKGRISFDMAHGLGHILLHPWSESLDLISKEDFKSRFFVTTGTHFFVTDPVTKKCVLVPCHKGRYNESRKQPRRYPL